MATIFDCSDSTGLLAGMRLARAAIGRGELIVAPTDTVYGVAADAFNPDAVQRLLDAKGRTRQSPPPVLVPSVETLTALAAEVPPEVQTLVDVFWPGGLTIILPAQESLRWDLGDTGGTVALRMPSNVVMLELLAETGPLAVSSANLTGQPAAMTAAAAEGMLGASVSVYLDGGDAGQDYGTALGAGTGSTIVDATGLLDGGELVIVRHGVIPDEAIWAALAEAAEKNATEAGEKNATEAAETNAPAAAVPEHAEENAAGHGELQNASTAEAEAAVQPTDLTQPSDPGTPINPADPNRPPAHRGEAAS